jgi:hypothetical protein
MSTNRREFLKRTGGLALAGFAGVSGVAAAVEATTTPTPAAPASRGAGSVERWLLETGRHNIDDDLYRAVAEGKA